MPEKIKSAGSERPRGKGRRVALLRSRFNAAVVDGLVAGAKTELLACGVVAGDIQVFEVPGAFELPLAAREAGRTRRFEAIVALGAVIRGETDHYEHIARAATLGLEAAARETAVPVGFGLLTVVRAEQALERSKPGPDNKGAEAARAALALAEALDAIRDGSGG